MLHWLHRTAYMGERMAYAQKCSLACQMPGMYLSLISDGMAQNHCILPWMGNLSQLKGLPQHLQGILRHGRGLTLYRTFHNDTLKEEGKLPDTVFYQIDGGSENAAKAVLLLCELLIIRGLTKKVVLTRLMVGHTHADIDAVFGRLWKAICTSHVLTPGAYKREIERALSTPAYRAKVVDVFVVPDYTSFLLGGLDPEFGRYSKTEYTQLVFTCEAVGISVDFPLGCRTTYRAYCKDEVVEIVSDATSPFGLRPQTAMVATFPAQTADSVGGMYLMRKIPHKTTIDPMPFVAGSRDLFDTRLMSFENHFQAGSSVIAEWQQWGEHVIPQSDNVNDHIERHPEHFYVPFLDRLFSTNEVNPMHVAPVPTVTTEHPVVYTTDSIQWSRRGQPRPEGDPHNHPRLTADGVGIPVPVKQRRKRKPKEVELGEDGLPLPKVVKSRAAPKTARQTADKRAKTVYSSAPPVVTHHLPQRTLSEDEFWNATEQCDYFENDSCSESEATSLGPVIKPSTSSQRKQARPKARAKSDSEVDSVDEEDSVDEVSQQSDGSSESEHEASVTAPLVQQEELTDEDDVTD
eukprot:gene35770-44106_t